MKVSIIIPIYNVEKEIERCLESVLKQDHPEIEIILVNDCTPDSSIILAKQIIKNSTILTQAIFVEHTVNQGLSAARNSGIKASSGDYLFFLDSDDALSHSGVISSLIALNNKGNREKYEVIIGNYQQISDDDKVLGMQKDYDLQSQLDVYSAYTKGDLSITAWGRLIQRSFVTENQLYFKEGIYHEDELWSFSVFQRARKVITTSSVIYDYHERIGSISFEIKERNVTDLNTVIQELYQIYLTEDKERRSYTALKIEKLKRRSFKWMSHFEDQVIHRELMRLKCIHTGYSSKNIKLYLQNFIFKLPNSLATSFLKKRWGKR